MENVKWGGASVELVDACEGLVATAEGVGRLLLDLACAECALDEGAREACAVLGRSLERAVGEVKELGRACGKAGR